MNTQELKKLALALTIWRVKLDDRGVFDSTDPFETPYTDCANRHAQLLGFDAFRDQCDWIEGGGVGEVTGDEPDLQVLHLTILRYADDDTQMYFVSAPTGAHQVSEDTFYNLADEAEKVMAETEYEEATYGDSLDTALAVLDIQDLFLRGATWAG